MAAGRGSILLYGKKNRPDALGRYDAERRLNLSFRKCRRLQREDS